MLQAIAEESRRTLRGGDGNVGELCGCGLDVDAAIGEDEAPVRTLLRKSLEREGYEVFEAGSAEEARALAEGENGDDRAA